MNPGDRHGRLAFESYVGPRRGVFLCDCGTRTVRAMRYNDRPSAQSCGCLRLERLRMALTKHGRCRTPEYRTWSGMLDRCYNEKNNRYERYGGRGIAVCERWRNSFEAFYADMGARPTLGHSIDRISNDGNYEPGNCRWATRVEQRRNSTASLRWLTIDGVTRLAREWAQQAGCPEARVHQRLSMGWDPKRAVFGKSPYGGDACERGHSNWALTSKGRRCLDCASARRKRMEFEGRW